QRIPYWRAADQYRGCDGSAFVRVAVRARRHLCGGPGCAAERDELAGDDLARSGRVLATHLRDQEYVAVRPAGRAALAAAGLAGWPRRWLRRRVDRSRADVDQ